MFVKVFDDGSIDESDFNLCPFWLQLQGFPTLWMTEKVGELFGCKAGKVIKVDANDGKLICVKWLSVRVLIDVTKPLKQSCWLNLSSGEHCWVTYKWEKVPDFCFVCGCMDHHENAVRR